MGEIIGRRGTERLGEPGSRTRVYAVRAASEGEAINTTLAQITAALGGTVLDGLPLSSIEAAEDTVAGVYTCTATFARTAVQAQFESRTGFEFSQETIRAKRAVSSARFPANAPALAGAIGVRRDENGRISVEGVDIPSSSFTFSKTKIYPISAINSGFLADIAALDKHTNAAPFAGFPAGEVLFLGLTGNQRSETEYECTFRFSRRPTEKNIVIDGIQVPIKRGWEYLDVLWDEAVDQSAHALVPRARAVYVHQVFHSANFAFLGLE